MEKVAVTRCAAFCRFAAKQAWPQCGHAGQAGIEISQTAHQVAAMNQDIKG